LGVKLVKHNRFPYHLIHENNALYNHHADGNIQRMLNLDNNGNPYN
jgi:hypothetical protein